MRRAIAICVCPLILSGCAAADPPATAGAAGGAGGCGLTRRAVLAVRTDGGTPLTTIWVDGKPADVVVDTGAATTFVTPPAAARLGLHPVAVPGTITGVGGAEGVAIAQLTSLAFGNVRVANPRMVVAATAARPGMQTYAPDGSLGDDVLHHFEVDLDLPHNQVTLYSGRPCGDALPGWTASDGTVPLARAFAPGWQVGIPVTIDGQAVRAMIDSGAASTVVGAGTAERSGVAASELGSDLQTRLTGIGPALAAANLHRFGSLQVGPETLRNVETAIMPVPFPGAELVLGADFLQTHKVWISYATGQVFLAHAW